MRHVIVPLAVCLSVAGASFCAAQTPPAKAPKAPPTAASVDPKAAAILTEMAAAYKALTSYSGEMEFTGTGMEGMPNQKSSIAFRRPNRAAVTTTTPVGVTRSVSDGATFFVHAPEEKAMYLKTAAAEGDRAITSAIARGKATGLGILPLLVVGSDPLAPIRDRIKSLSVGGPGSADSVEVDNVVAVLSTEQGDPQTFTFSVGKKDRLLHRMTMERTLRGKPIRLTETYTGIQANADIADSRFAFTPPAGAVPFTPPQALAPKLTPGAAPFPLDATDTADKPVTLEQYKGKVVLLDFWISESEEWNEALPKLKAIHARYRGQGFDIVGVGLEPDAKALRDFVKENKIGWRQVWDEGAIQGNGKITRLYGVETLPSNVLIGRDGKIAATGVYGDDLEAAVKAALAKR